MAAVELDHVSLVVPGDLDAVCERWGWRLSPGSGPEHGRVHLDYRYLELRRGARLEVVAVFFGNANGEAQTLCERGLSLGPPQTYHGHDGVWEDRLIDGFIADPLMMALTRRVSPSGPWPPALEHPHPNGALSLDRVHVSGQIAVLEPLATSSLLALTLAPGVPRVTAPTFGTTGSPLMLPLPSETVVDLVRCEAK
jgi:hypothetical protein